MMFLRDLIIAGRSLTRARGLSLTVIATLAAWNSQRCSPRHPVGCWPSAEDRTWRLLQNVGNRDQVVALQGQKRGGRSVKLPEDFRLCPRTLLRENDQFRAAIGQAGPAAGIPKLLRRSTTQVALEASQRHSRASVPMVLPAALSKLMSARESLASHSGIPAFGHGRDVSQRRNRTTAATLALRSAISPWMVRPPIGAYANTQLDERLSTRRRHS
jgi:hypothetical protein